MSKRWLAAAVVLAAIPVSAPAQAAVKLDWKDCGAPYECAVASVPLDYAKPSGPKLDLNVARLPHTGGPGQFRGPLFINFGGPGDSTSETFRDVGEDLYASLRANFDIIAVDPRGTGPNGLDCKVNQETQGLYAHPFWTNENTTEAGVKGRALRYVRRCRALNDALLPYVTTANTARDMDAIRAATGAGKLNYFGFSYGTFLGETYAALFPSNYRSMVLDGTIDPDQYINRPSENLFTQSVGFETAYGRFFQACAAHKDVCPFDGDDPWDAYDQLVARANAHPIPEPGSSQTIDGDEINFASAGLLYAKDLWPLLAEALDEADHGDGGLMQDLVDDSYGRLDDGTFDPFGDRYYLIGAVEQNYPTDLAYFMARGDEADNYLAHTVWNAGYPEYALGALGVQPNGVFRGPFRVPQSSSWILVVGNTYDPATPLVGARAATRELGKARLLTMRGDGHTAYLEGSPCIDEAIDAYLIKYVLPSKGTTCKQDLPFGGPEATAQKMSASAEKAKQWLLRPHRRVLKP